MTKKNGLITAYDETGNKLEIYPKVETDTTLTKSNMAADSYTVGAKFKEAENKITETKQSLTGTIDSKTEALQYAINQLQAAMESKFDAMIGKIYPVGSIYISVSNTNPKDLFGGTWEQIKDRFILSAGDTYEAGSTGGSANHTHSLSNNGAACIGNYSNTLAFSTGTLYAKDNKGSGAWYWTHNADAEWTESNDKWSSLQWVGLAGNTDSAGALPPYLAVYVWKRTA